MTSDGSDAAATADQVGGAAASSSSTDAHAALRSLLECTVCYSVMLPPIRQCDDGHNFCDRCCTKLMTSAHDSARKCPMCRIKLKLPVARARNLERWATESGIEITCEFAPCCERYQYGQHAEHKMGCLGQTIGCPLRCCTWRGQPSALAQHLVGKPPAPVLAAPAAAPAPPPDGEHSQPADERAPALPPPSAPPSAPAPPPQPPQPPQPHGLEEVGARYSARHSDYSTTLVFSTQRPADDRRRWRPPRQLISIPPNNTLGTPPLSFCVALWKPRGRGQPVLAAIQALRPPCEGEASGAVGYSYDLSISAYPRPPVTRCVSRVSAVGAVPELGCNDVWTRPPVKRVSGPLLVADRRAIAMFNTVGLGPQGEAVQRYEVHVRLTPLTAERASAQPHMHVRGFEGFRDMAAAELVAHRRHHPGYGGVEEDASASWSGDEDDRVGEMGERRRQHALEDEDEEDEEEEEDEEYDEDDEDEDEDEDEEIDDEDDEDDDDDDERSVDEDDDEGDEDEGEEYSSTSVSSESSAEQDEDEDDESDSDDTGRSGRSSSS